MPRSSPSIFAKSVTLVRFSAACSICANNVCQQQSSPGRARAREAMIVRSSRTRTVRIDISIVVITLRVMPAWLLITRSVMPTLHYISSAGRKFFCRPCFCRQEGERRSMSQTLWWKPCAPNWSELRKLSRWDPRGERSVARSVQLSLKSIGPLCRTHRSDTYRFARVKMASDCMDTAELAGWRRSASSRPAYRPSAWISSSGSATE